MITPKDLQERLAEKPFRPFCVFMSDGSKHEVPHPEFAWVFSSSLFVGKSGELPFGLDAYVRQLSILHVSRIEPLAKAKARARAKK